MTLLRSQGKKRLAPVDPANWGYAKESRLAHYEDCRWQVTLKLGVVPVGVGYPVYV